MSNMGYLSTILTPETRDKAGPKNGATSMVTVNIDPLGAVSVTADVTVQGQGHETVLAQIVADQLGFAAQRCRRDAGNGHGEGPVVDRRRHLLLPLHAGHRGRRAHGGGPHGRKAQEHRGEAAQRAGRTTSSWPTARSAASSNPDNAAAVQPRRRHLALVAGDAAGGHGAGHSARPACGIRRSSSRRRTTTASTPR